MFEYIGKIIATGLMVIASIFSPTIKDIPQQTPNFGGVNAVAGKVYYLSGSGVSSSATTITLTNFDVAGGTTNLTMSDFGDRGCGTIEPGHSTRQEFVSFTGITQNADGTATLSGVTRGLSPVSPYTASTTQQKAHSGGSTFVISNSPPCFYEGYASLSQDEAVTGLWNFNSYLPTTSITATSSNQFTTKGYVDGVAVAGAPNADESTKGIVELATQTEMASSTNLGGTSASLVLQSRYATSSPYTTGLYIPITRNDGKLNPNFIATSTSDLYRFQNLEIASSTHTATTSISANSLTNGALILNNVPYKLPSTRSASSTVLTENGSGDLVWMPPTGRQYTYASTTGMSVTAANGYATTSMITIPANTLTSSSTIIVEGSVAFQDGGSGSVYLRDSTGTTFASFQASSNGTGDSFANFKFLVVSSNGTITSQKTIVYAEEITPQTTTTCGGGACSFIVNKSTSGTSTINLANSLNLNIVIRAIGADTSLNIVSAIVNP